jgi:hypothetical protein
VAASGDRRSHRWSAQELMNTPVGRLADHEWGMIVTAVIFGWVKTRVGQAIAEGRDSEQMVRATGLEPDPCDVAVVKSVLSELADTAAIDWSLPLTRWTPNTMTSFLLLAWKLIAAAETARDHGGGKILRKTEVAKVQEEIPF